MAQLHVFSRCACAPVVVLRNVYCSAHTLLRVAMDIEAIEYRCILQNMDVIIDHLKTCCGTKEELLIKYQKGGWLRHTENPETAAALVRQALTRIATFPSQYSVFMAMLKGVVGMEIVVDKIEGVLAISYINQ